MITAVSPSELSQDPTGSLLKVQSLTIYNRQWGKNQLVLDHVHFEIRRSQFAAVVGRSGIGKSLILKAILGLLDVRYWAIEGDIIWWRSRRLYCEITGEPCKPGDRGCPLQHGKNEYFVIDSVQGSVKKFRCRSLMSPRVLVEPTYVVEKGSYHRELISEIRGRSILTEFQGADDHLNPSLSIGWQIGETIDPRRPLKDSHLEEINRRIKELDLPVDCPRRYPHQLAQGQRQRVMIAMALSRAELVILDEPTSALHRQVKLEIIDILKSLRRRGTVTSLLLITHDREVIEGVLEGSDPIYILDRRANGNTGIVESLPADSFHLASRLAHFYDLPCSQLGLHPLLENVDPGWFEKPAGKEPSGNKRPILFIRGLWQAYRQGAWGRLRWVLRNLDLAVTEGEFLGILGTSGCGKTTLAKAIVRLLNHTRGEIWYYCPELMSEPLDSLRRLSKDRSKIRNGYVNLVGIQPNGFGPDGSLMKLLRREIQLIFQDSATIFNPRMTIRELFAETLMKVLNVIDPEMLGHRIRQTLLEFRICGDEKDIEDTLNKYSQELSGGEKQRLAIARVFLLRPRLIIADELFAAQDRITVKEIVSMMDQLRNMCGTAFIIISHDIELVRSICDRVITI